MFYFALAILASPAMAADQMPDFDIARNCGAEAAETTNPEQIKAQCRRDESIEAVGSTVVKVRSRLKASMFSAEHHWRREQLCGASNLPRDVFRPEPHCRSATPKFAVAISVVHLVRPAQSRGFASSCAETKS